MYLPSTVIDLQSSISPFCRSLLRLSSRKISERMLFVTGVRFGSVVQTQRRDARGIKPKFQIAEIGPFHLPAVDAHWNLRAQPCDAEILQEWRNWNYKKPPLS